MENYWHSKNVLVTGGAGFIGSTLARRLAREGARVAVTSRSETPWRLEGSKDIEVHVVDLREEDGVRRILAQVRPEFVFNLASSLAHDQGTSDIEERIEQTFGIARSVVLASVAADVRRIVHLGTIEEYGGLNVVADETMRESPISPYSLGKVMATHFALTIGRLLNKEICVVRPAATYGPTQGPGMLIPNLIAAGIEGRNFDMNKGEQMRDLIFVDDVVDGIVRVGAYEQASGHIFNLGSGTQVRIRDVVEGVLEHLQKPIEVNFGVHPYRPQDPALLALNSQKARDLLRWRPTVTLRDGLKRTVTWYEQHYQETHARYEKK